MNERAPAEKITRSGEGLRAARPPRVVAAREGDGRRRRARGWGSAAGEPDI
jgi:hypothetical protein|eukprot:COSAG06_NODE_940_length_11390_cov_3.311133_2_plen_51_part_00